jgi:hypothetical protein
MILWLSEQASVVGLAMVVAVVHCLMNVVEHASIGLNGVTCAEASRSPYVAPIVPRLQSREWQPQRICCRAFMDVVVINERDVEVVLARL